MAAPRAYWKGTLKLSLVSCPVALYPASTTVEKTRFHMINRETGNRLKQQMVDTETGDIVEGDQKGRGYEVSKGKYVEIEKDELEAVQIESNHTIDIDAFVPESEIDKRYLDHPYYIRPDGKAGIDAFAVIRDAMKDQDRVALARIVLTNREHIIALEPLDNGLMGTLLRYPYEVRSEKEYFDDIQDVKITKDMLDLAKHIVEQKSAEFDPEEFEDRYEQALIDLINQKRNGIKIAKPAAKASGNVINLMDALKKSLANEKQAAPAKADAKAAKGKKPKKRIEGQREMLLPISGSGKREPKEATKPEPKKAEKATRAQGTAARKKAG